MFHIAACRKVIACCFSFLCGQAESDRDAEDGIKFMQEMIELAKQRNDESGTTNYLLIFFVCMCVCVNLWKGVCRKMETVS